MLQLGSAAGSAAAQRSRQAGLEPGSGGWCAGRAQAHGGANKSRPQDSQCPSKWVCPVQRRTISLQTTQTTPTPELPASPGQHMLLRALHPAASPVPSPAAAAAAPPRQLLTCCLRCAAPAAAAAGLPAGAERWTAPWPWHPIGPPAGRARPPPTGTRRAVTSLLNTPGHHGC